MSIVYLNGKFLPLKQARISVLDRGFLFCDGIFEVITVYHGQPFQLKEHLKRLKENLKAIHLPLKITNKAWEKIFQSLLEKNHTGKKNKSLYLQITRGTQTKREYGIPSSKIKPTLFIMLKELQQPNYDHLKKGFKIITHEDIRWKLCHIKTTSLLPNILLAQEAKQQNAEETVLIRDGNVLEGTNSNIFIVKNNKIFTPPTSQSLLGGITRKLVLALASEHHIAYQEKSIKLKDLYQADEVWITSSSRDIMPIGKVDNHKIKEGKPGPLWQEMTRYFQEIKQV